MTIYVYAIAKNEKKFAERFMRSCAGADGVVVLDTGSTDGTPDALRGLGAEPYDLAAIACWHLRRLEDAENYAETALCHAPEDARLQNNLRLIREAMSDGDRAD